MSEKNTVGSFVLKALLIVVGFNFIYSMLVFFVDYLKGWADWLTSTFGTGWFLYTFVSFLKDGVLAWLFLILADATAIAVILFISMILEAYETEWK